MKTVSSICVIAACLVVCAVVARDAEAAGRRIDPNAVDKVPSPFHGTVANVTATTLTVKGDVKVKSNQPANGEPRSTSGARAKETAVAHTINFFIKPDTKVTRDGKAGQLKDIHQGDTVAVTFTTKDGSSLKHVTEVAVGSGAAEDQPKAEKKKAKK